MVANQLCFLLYQYKQVWFLLPHLLVGRECSYQKSVEQLDRYKQEYAAQLINPTEEPEEETTEEPTEEEQ